MRRTLIVMVKEPRPGRVKTRLGREIGHIAACWWFRHAVTRLLRRIRDPRWTIVLAVAPDTAVTSRVWPALPRIAQGRGDLGARMARVMAAQPAGPVCLIGADIPGITRSHVWRAFRALGENDAVFGPAEDGGFWLVGFRHDVPRTVFDGARWSSAHALSDVLANLRDARVAQVDCLTDVDTASDLARMKTSGRQAF